MSNKLRVCFIHLRPFNGETKRDRLGRLHKIFGEGAVTVAYQFDEDTGLVQRVAYSRCAPTDQFNKKVGRIKAEGRLKSDRLSFIPDEEIDYKEFVAEMHKEYKEGLVNDTLFCYPTQYCGG